MSKKKIMIIVLSSIVALSLIIGGVFFIIFKVNDNNGWITITSPTCETMGVQERTNSKGEKEIQTIPALGHVYTTNIKQASCLRDGFTVYTCSRCDSTYISDFQNALQHQYGEWTTKKNATCTSSGLEEHFCELCGEKDSKILKSKGHSYAPISAETIDSVTYVKYKCEGCDKTETIKEGEDFSEAIGSEMLFDVQTSFSFTIKTTKDEAYIRENLRIVDAYFKNTEYEEIDGINIEYTLKKVDSVRGFSSEETESTWEVIPAVNYEPDITYIAELSGDVEFEEYSGEELTFTIEEDEEHVNEVEYREDIVFLYALEMASPGYYPYALTASEKSESLYLTVGKIDGILEGQIICIGDIASAQEITPDTECDFGKVEDIYQISSGEWIIILAEPELEEIFSAFDISYEDIIDLESGSADIEDIEAELINSLYTSESFIQFLGSVNVASNIYAKERSLEATSVATVDAFMQNVSIKPSIRFNKNKLFGKIDGALNIPLSDSNKNKIGNIKVSFVFEVESLFDIDVSYKLKKKLKIPYGVKYFDIGITQNDTYEFSFDVSINIDYSLEEGKYIQNIESGKIHRDGCVHVSSIKDTSKLRRVSVKNAEKQISQNQNLECKHCHPTQEFYYDLLVLQKETKVIHAYNCMYAGQISEANREISDEKVAVLIEQGYTCCDWCHPDEREIRSYKNLIIDSLKYSDWQQITTDISQWAKSSGYEEGVRNEKRITGVDIPIYGPVKASIDIYFVINFGIDASIDYNYKYTQTNKYGMRIEGGSPSPYSTKTSKTLSNKLTAVGYCKISVGLLVDANVNISGLEKWIRAGVTAEVGLYSEAAGVLNLSFIEEEKTENYAAAYFEAGIYLDIEAYYKVFKWKGDVDIYSDEWPILQMGYERVYYSYVSPIDTLEIDEAYNIESLLDVKYIELKTLSTGQEKLKIDGVAGIYDITLSLGNGEYFKIVDGRILITASAPCYFEDSLIIKVKGNAKWSNYIKGSSVFYLEEYVIALIGSGDIHNGLNEDCTICTGDNASRIKGVESNIVGVDMYLMALICESLDMKMEIVELDAFDTLVYEVYQNNGVVASGITRNTVREQFLIFSQQYYSSQHCIVSKQADNFNSFEDLKDKRVGIKKGSLGEYAMGNELEKGSLIETNTEVVYFDTVQQAYEGLKNSKCDCIVVEEMFVSNLLSGNTFVKNNVDIYSNDYYDGANIEYAYAIDEKYNFAVGKERSDKDFIINGMNDVINKLEPSELDKIMAYYLALQEKRQINFSIDTVDLSNNSGDTLVVYTYPDWPPFEFFYKQYSEGLEYRALRDNEMEIGYEVVGMGNCSDTNLVIPKTYRNLPVMRIAENAFDDCSSLLSVDIPNTIEWISSRAFANCTSLLKVKFEKNSKLLEIGSNAFSGCSALYNIDLPDSVNTVSKGAFDNCPNELFKTENGLIYLSSKNNEYFALIGVEDKNLTNYNIGQGVQVIAAEAFSECKAMKVVVIPYSVVAIGDRAFDYCYNLESVVFDSNSQLIIIGANAFSMCQNLRSINIPSTVLEIGQGAFHRCGLVVFTEDNLIYLSNDNNKYFAVIGVLDKGLLSYNINNETKVIAVSAFSDCDSLVEIEIPSSVSAISRQGFFDCNGLKKVVIAENSQLKHFGMCAFLGCDNLSEIIFNGTLEQWQSVYKSYAWVDGIPATYVQCLDAKVEI